MLEIFDYSEKAVAVFGDTKPVKEILKSLGGRFNPYLTHPERQIRMAGWIFSKKKKAEVQAFIESMVEA